MDNKFGIVIGIAIIVSVATLLALPFMESDVSVQKLPIHNQKLTNAEGKMLDFINHEKTELELKLAGKIKP